MNGVLHGKLNAAFVVKGLYKIINSVSGIVRLTTLTTNIFINFMLSAKDITSVSGNQCLPL